MESNKEMFIVPGYLELCDRVEKVEKAVRTIAMILIIFLYIYAFRDVLARLLIRMGAEV